MIRKVWTIAQREYGAMVATKAFLLSITLMPVMMLGGIVVASRLKDVRDLDDQKIVVVDGSDGVLFDHLKQAADEHNESLAHVADAAATSNSENVAAAPRYLLERHPANTLTDDERLSLSNRVRNDEIAAFVEIPENILSDILSDQGETESSESVRFHAPNAILSPERRWLDRQLNDAVTASRLAKMDIDAEAVKKATTPVRVVPLGLFRQSSDGNVRGAAEDRNMAGIFVPFGVMMLMFLVIFLSAQPMLESVLEEKSERIAEVLLGSASPFQLMLGKLLGNVAGSLSVVAIYAVGGCLAAAYNDWTDMIPLDLVPWFLVFQVLAVLLFSSVFMAVGASVSQLKEAQSMLLPVWLILACPMFVWLQIVREPNGTIATWMSFFPPATPMVMVLRLASEAVVPWWQPLVGLVLLIATTLCCIYLAGRVFRIGILWQGKTPRVGELARWAFRG